MRHIVFILLVASCVVNAGKATATAEPENINNFEVKDEETQLARRFAVREAVDSPFEYALGIGYRQDSLNWSIANGGINVASELSWSHTVISQIRAAARANLAGEWFLRGLYTTGAVKSGSNRDSDYAGSNRTQEYSRSDNKTGGAVHDVSLGMGRRIHLFEQAGQGGLYVSPLLGYSIHQQGLTMVDGRQTIPFDAALAGLNNNYDAQWKGPWLGVDALFAIGQNILLNSSLEYHRVDYSAKANWNLRSDLAHPLSFRHSARGHGVSVSVGISYRFSRNLLLNAVYDHQRWSTVAGNDQTYFSYGATAKYVLNPVKWNLTAVTLGAVYEF